MGEARRRCAAEQGKIALLERPGIKPAIAAAMRSIHFEFGPGGTCWYRVATGLYALGTMFGLPARLCLGSMLYRARS